MEVVKCIGGVIVSIICCDKWIALATPQRREVYLTWCSGGWMPAEDTPRWKKASQDLSSTSHTALGQMRPTLGTSSRQLPPKPRLSTSLVSISGLTCPNHYLESADTQQVSEAGGSLVENLPGLHSELKVSLGNLVRGWLNVLTKQKETWGYNSMAERLSNM